MSGLLIFDARKYDLLFWNVEEGVGGDGKDEICHSFLPLLAAHRATQQHSASGMDGVGAIGSAGIGGKSVALDARGPDGSVAAVAVGRQRDATRMAEIGGDLIEFFFGFSPHEAEAYQVIILISQLPFHCFIGDLFL